MAPPSDPFTTVLAKLEEIGLKFDTMECKTDATNTKIKEMQLSVQQIQNQQSAMTNWKPELEHKVTDLQNSVFLLKKNLDLFIHELSKPHAVEDDTLIGVSSPAHLGATAAAGTPR